MKTTLAETYAENIRHNIEAVKAARIETATFIRETEKQKGETDGRKRGAIELLESRIKQARETEERQKEKVLWLDSLESHAEEVAWLDEQIRALVDRRKSLVDITKPDPFKTKWYGVV